MMMMINPSPVWVTIGIFTFTIVTTFIGFLVRQFLVKPIQKLEKLLDDYPTCKSQHQLMYKAWEQEALDAIRMLNNPNPHPKRMHDLLTKFTNSVASGDDMSPKEVDELIALLTAALNDKSVLAQQRTWASKALRFVEGRKQLQLITAAAAAS